MNEIKINYNEVNVQTKQLMAHIQNDLIPKIESEYSRISDILNRVDSSTNASLIESMEMHKNKSIIAAQSLEKLLSFMSNSSLQLEQNEFRMATAFKSESGN